MSSMHHRRAGYPFGMLIDFAADGAGSPVFCLSSLSIHSSNLRDDPRCSLVVQMPGWLGLSDARVTIFGDAYELPAEAQVCSFQLLSRTTCMLLWGMRELQKYACLHKYNILTCSSIGLEVTGQTRRAVEQCSAACLFA